MCIAFLKNQMDRWLQLTTSVATLERLDTVGLGRCGGGIDGGGMAGGGMSSLRDTDRPRGS